MCRRMTKTPMRVSDTAAAMPALRALLLALALAACQSVQLRPELPDTLAASPALAVSGRTGWLPDRSPLRFGDFATSARRVAEQTTRVPCPAGCSRFNLGIFGVTFETQRTRARQTLVFTQEGPGAPALRVEAFQAREKEEREWTWQAFGLNLRDGQSKVFEQPFSGTLVPLAGAGPAWRFVLGNPVAPTPGADAEAAGGLGFAESESGQRIELRALIGAAERTGGGRATLRAGYRLEIDGRTVGAVSVFGSGQGQGEVWLAPQIDPALRQAAAALISTLLLRPFP